MSDPGGKHTERLRDRAEKEGGTAGPGQVCRPRPRGHRSPDEVPWLVKAVGLCARARLQGGTMATVNLEKVTKVYPNGKPAVLDLDLDVAEGELMVLVGPSGSGKTTALRMVAGLEEITSGTLTMGGRV